MPARRVQLDVSWHHRAACRSSPIDFLHPHLDQLDQALAVCRSCVVLDHCRSLALDAPPLGVILAAVVWSASLQAARHQHAELRHTHRALTTH